MPAGLWVALVSAVLGRAPAGAAHVHARGPRLRPLGEAARGSTPTRGCARATRSRFWRAGTPASASRTSRGSSLRDALDDTHGLSLRRATSGSSRCRSRSRPSWPAGPCVRVRLLLLVGVFGAIVLCPPGALSSASCSGVADAAGAVNHYGGLDVSVRALRPGDPRRRPPGSSRCSVAGRTPARRARGGGHVHQSAALFVALHGPTGLSRPLFGFAAVMTCAPSWPSWRSAAPGPAGTRRVAHCSSPRGRGHGHGRLWPRPRGGVGRRDERSRRARPYRDRHGGRRGGAHYARGRHRAAATRPSATSTRRRCPR